MARIACERQLSLSTGRNAMDRYLHGRRINISQNYERPSPEVLHLIRKLRRVGMEAKQNSFK
jgi:hypothetical protein